MGMVWPQTTPVTAEVAAVTPLWGGNEVCTFYPGRSISSTLHCSSVHQAVTQPLPLSFQVSFGFQVGAGRVVLNGQTEPGESGH